MGLLSDKKQKVADMDIDEVKRMIRDGELLEGDKLPNQSEFAALLGVSRPSLREAMRSLKSMGVIEQTPGLGTVLKSGNPDYWTNLPAPPLLSDQESTLQFLEARRDIEAMTIPHVVGRINDEELAEIESGIEKMQKALDLGDTVEYRRLDMLFHYQLANASHNRYIIHVFVEIRYLMDEFIKESVELFPQLLPKSLEGHRAIHLAILKRDERQAVCLVKQHIDNFQQMILDYYASLES
jgi:GntR family transcriptional regulator, transcriptional repressor for pyruvate dehydrogenase complex